MADIPITPGTGGSSVATELVGARNFQLIEMVGKGGASTLGVNPDGTISVSVVGTITTTATQGASVSGTVGASIIGQLPGGNAVLGAVAASISGIVTVNSIYGNISGSVFAVVSGMQGASVSGTVGASIIGQLPSGTAPLGSVATLQGTNPWIITGSVQGNFTPSGNQSVSGTVGASIVGQLPAGTAPIGSVATLQGTNPWIITGSVQGAFSPSGNQSVSGTVGASIIGQLPAGNAVIGAVAASISGIVTVNSIYGNISGSVFAVVSGLQGASISGTVTVSGLQGASISGTVGASIIGIVPVLPAVYTTSVQGISSVMTGTTSVLVLGAPGGTSRNYITHILVTNGATVGTTVTIQDGASILWGGYAAASGGGWSENFNPPLPQPTSVKALYATSSVQASVLVGISGFTGV